MVKNIKLGTDPNF